MNRVLILAALSLTPAAAAAQWAALTSGTDEHLHKIAFRNADTGFCVGGGDTYGFPVPGAKGIILRTADGGASWVTVMQDTTMAFSELAINGDTILAAGRTLSDPVVARSTDGGLSWSVTVAPDFRLDLKAHGGSVYYTEGGWLRRATGNATSVVCPSPALYDVTDAGIYQVGAKGTLSYFVARSQNSGVSWDTSIIAPNPFSLSPFTNAAVRSFGDTIIVCATYPGTVAFSYDNGAVWNSSAAVAPYGCFISSPHVITGIAGGRWIARSNDGGHSFAMQDSLPNTISQFYFVSESLGYVCGQNGMIYKTVNGGGIPPNAVAAPAESNPDIRLYPNPSSDLLMVSSGIRVGSIVVYSLTGQQVLNMPVAGQTTALKVGSLPAGLYQIAVAGSDGRIVVKRWTKQ